MRLKREKKLEVETRANAIIRRVIMIEINYAGSLRR